MDIDFSQLMQVEHFWLFLAFQIDLFCEFMLCVWIENQLNVCSPHAESETLKCMISCSCGAGDWC